MRDCKRIPRITEKLMKCWCKVPDWRLCQLFENLRSFSGRQDLFYVEDEDFEKLIDKFIEEMGL